MLALGALVLQARHWSFARLGVSDFILLPCVAFLCVWPGVRWYRRGANWVPLGEVFCALHLFYYVLPCLNDRPVGAAYSYSEPTQALMALALFLGTFVLVYDFIAIKPHRSTPLFDSLLRRQAAPAAIWGMFFLWLLWSAIAEAGLLIDMGSALNIFRSIFNASGILSVLYLSFQVGRRAISKLQGRVALGGLAIGMILNLAAGYLNGPVQWMAAALLGFTLGRKRVPVATIVVCALLLTLLQLGKAEYRRKYWGKRQNYVTHRVNVVESFSTWLGAGWDNLWRDDSRGGAKQASLAERANLLPVLTTAMKVVPDEKPFLFGLTYRMLPKLMIPRIFWPAKPRGTAPTEAVGVYIGITTPEATNYSSIAVGPIVEAWVNFGWLGMVVAGAFFSALFGLPILFTKALLPDQIGWLMAAIFLICAANLEHTAPETVCSLFTSLSAGVAVLLLISREAPISPRTEPAQ